MKRLRPLILVLLACCQIKVSGDEVLVARSPDLAGTSIPHSLEVPAFTPPAPAMPKPVPVMRVDSAVTVPTTDSLTLTLIRGEASTLPDIPIPPVMPARQPRVLTDADRERLIYQRRHTLQIGATTYDHRVSRVNWRHPDTGENFEALCGFDLGLLAGIGSFVHAGETYSLVLVHSAIDTTKSRLFASRHAIETPDVPVGGIRILKGNAGDPSGAAPINLLAELIMNEKSRLIAYQAARLQHQQAAAEWQKAHPPVPRDETIWFKPHRGSRYLADPQPEAAAR